MLRSIMRIKGLKCLPRQLREDPSIVESWL